MLADADAAVRARDREETKRLLYVGITRARDRLYLAASLTDGKLKAGRGSLAELLPEALQDTITQAGAHAGEGVVEWEAAPGRRHALRVCGPAGAPKAGAGADTGQEAVPDDFGIVSDPAPVSRTSVTAQIAVEVGAGASDAADEPIDRISDPAAALTGTLVHRLFQFDSQAWDEPRSIDDVVEQARRLCRAEELAAVDRPDDLIRQGAKAYLAIRRQPAVQSVLASGECLFEVPFSVAQPDGPAAGGTRILRGAIDCVVRRPDGSVVVVDFKTGQPRREHQLQVDHYVRAARLAFGASRADGLLVYPERS
jgi:ATP-dependent helicase/nuclease subunit A